MKTFVDNLKRIMATSGLDIDEFAAKCGIDKNIIESFLAGKSYPKPSELVKIAGGLSLPFESLLKPFAVIPPDFNCKLIAIDIDGVMTDGGMYVTSDRREMKKFNTRDGMAMRIAARLGVEVGFISNGLMEDLIAYRAEMIHVKRWYVGNEKKLPVLEGWCKEMGISLSEVAFIGDDINDMEVMQQVGLSVCPADAVPAIKAVSKIVLQTKGGHGCVREFGEMLGWTK
jgi:3-deoxy-D-manno-octulosonate 8-phosphate phosphatase (KDO 8-P phosphatase)